MRHSLEVGGEYEAEYRVIGREGTARWIVARGQVERDANGKPLRLRGVSVDITERKRSEEALRETEERLSLAADSADAGLWSWDFKSNRIWATARSRELYGFSSDEPISLEKVLEKVHADDREWVGQTAQKCAQEGSAFQNEYRVMLEGWKTGMVE